MKQFMFDNMGAQTPLIVLEEGPYQVRKCDNSQDAFYIVDKNEMNCLTLQIDPNQFRTIWSEYIATMICNQLNENDKKPVD